MSCVTQHTRLLAGVLSLLLLGLAGCSSTVPREVLPDDIVTQAELVETPFYAQELYQCGPASLAMALGQRGVGVSPDELVEKVYLPERQGSVVPEMVATARSYGMVVYELPPSLDALLREVAAGNPVLVLQNLGFSWWPTWHYAVVIGYDIEAQRLTLRSGVTERHQVSLGLFDRTWRRGKRWGMVLLPPGALPASNDHFRYQKGAYALEQVGQHEAALSAYRAATEQWPEESLPWLSRSNLEYRQKRYSEAEQSLRSALHAIPDAAQLWNNFGYVLMALGCQTEASQAVDCAIALQPEEDGYRQSREEIAGMRAVKRKTPLRCEPVNCPVPARQE
ncbi:MAG: PA2778 family cysteine peptidase [Chromatiales bacterium]|nr:PA2778 family cysteine peptidase [Chromatiales bacterium]